MTPFRRARLLAGLSQDEIAGKLGYSVREVAKWDRGEVEPRPAVYWAMIAIVAIAKRVINFERLLPGVVVPESRSVEPNGQDGNP